MMSTPPIVGVPCFPPCNSARLAHFGGSCGSAGQFSSEIKFANDVVAEEKRDDESGDRRQDSAKSDVIENVEPFELLRQTMEVKHHDAQRVSIGALGEFLQHPLGARGAAAFDEDKIARARDSRRADRPLPPDRTTDFACCQASGSRTGGDLGGVPTERDETIDA